MSTDAYLCCVRSVQAERRPGRLHYVPIGALDLYVLVAYVLERIYFYRQLRRSKYGSFRIGVVLPAASFTINPSSGEPKPVISAILSCHRRSKQPRYESTQA
jgi:hypothetical protein